MSRDKLEGRHGLMKRTVLSIFAVATLWLFLMMLFSDSRWLDSSENVKVKWFTQQVSNDTFDPADDDGAVRVLLLAYMRSGSTLLSEILTLNDSFNLLNEPLWMFTKSQSGVDWSTPAMTESAAQMTARMFHCDLLLIRMLTSNRNINRTRFNVSHCSRRPLLIKSIRLHGVGLSRLLQLLPRLKVVHLVRDPRAILSSRAALGRPLAAKELCAHIEADMRATSLLRLNEPHRYHRVRLEDVSNEATSATVIEQMYRFVGVPVNSSVLDDYLHSHNYVPTIDRVLINMFGTFRPRGFDINQWRFSMDMQDIRRVQRDCEQVMRLLDYAPCTPQQDC